MNDLEDLVREELRARAEAADAEHPADSAAALLGRLDRRIRTARTRRRLWSASALSAAAAAVAVTLPLTLLSTPPIRVITQGQMPRDRVPLSDPGLTPPGWTPLTYRNAQFSVPSSWPVQGPRGSVCGVTSPGAVLIGRRFRPQMLGRSWCRLPPTMVFVSAIPIEPRPTQRLCRNGIPAALQHGVRDSLSCWVSPLGVRMTAFGPKASEVISTLTRSPRSVALAPGPRFRVPSGWAWHDFGGIVFAAPPAWRVERTDKWGSCFSRPVLSGALRLSTATEFGCNTLGMLTGQAGEAAPVAGMTVGAGRLAAAGGPPGKPWRCLGLRGVRACVQRQGMLAGEFLELVLHVPGRSRPTVVDIGLAGTGAIPRTILDSIRPA